jgi:MOSC domain-containing protein YiiM
VSAIRLLGGGRVAYAPGMFEGEVVSIFIAPEEGAPTKAVEEVRAVEGRGLEGDRYFTMSGTMSKRQKPEREVTLIESEAIAAVKADHDIDFALGDSRRNIVTRGVPLNHLVDKEFLVGDVVLRGIKLCHPCGYLESVTQDGVRAALSNRGGLNAQIVAGGTIRAGDKVRSKD